MKGRILHIFSTLSVVASFLFSNGQQNSFDKIPTQQGEANLSVRQIIQDDSGVLWMATFSGLYRYQGDDYIIQHEFNNNMQINNDVTCLVQDNQKNLWIGTNLGLAKYNLQTGELATYLNDKNDSSSVISNKIRSLCKDETGRIWIGTSDAGLCIYEPVNDTFQKIEFDTLKVRQPVYIKTIYDKGNGEIWLGTLNDGLYYFKYAENKVDTVCNYRAENLLHSLSNNSVYSIFSDSDGTMIVGTRNGLNIFDEGKKQFRKINIPNISNENMVNFIRSVYRDKSGKLWIGTWGGLILCSSVVDLEKGEFELIKHNRNIIHSVSHDQVMHVLEDNSGVIWIGTENGLNKYDSYQNQFQPLSGFEMDNLSEQTATGFYPYKNGMLILTLTDGILFKQGKIITKIFSDFLKPFENRKMYSILVDSKQNIWVGTFNGTLININPWNNSVSSYRHSNSGTPIYSLNEAANGNILLGTDGEGLKYFNPVTKTFSTENSLPGDALVSDIYFDKSGNLWVATAFGIFSKSSGSNSFEYYLPDNPDSISNPNIFFDVEETADGRIFVGGRNGLYEFVKNQNEFNVVKFRNDENLWVTNIQTDSKKNVWLNLNFNRIARLNLQNGVLHFFNVNNGIRSSQYNLRGFIIDENDQLFISGFDQIYQLNASNLMTNAYSPDPFLTKLVINNAEVHAGLELNGQLILEKNIGYQKRIVLNHQNKDFTLSFASASYLNSSENKYRYKLQGYDNDWHTGSEKLAHYTNLSPGKYTFEVFSANNDGVWSKAPAKLQISVKPPPFLSFWAVIFYIVVVTVSAFQIRRVVNARIQLRRELLIERVKRDNEEKFHQERLRFYTNISHELRTPLTLIMGPIKQLISEEKQNLANSRLHRLILNNSQRLLSLVNQLLDFRKSVYQGMKLKATFSNLVEIIETNLDAFSFMAKEKSIEVQFIRENKELNGWFDIEKLNIILFNIFSNAFKFTPECGSVTVELKNGNPLSFSGKPHVELMISNSGKGIPKNQQEKVFERFYQVPDEANSINTGTGIGLSLVKALVELHHGKITLESVPDEITCFTIFIPHERKEYSDEEVFDFKRDADRRTKELVDNFIQREGGLLNTETEIKPQKLLIVEDNAELSGFLSEYLSADYQVLTAGNGLEGLEICEKENPSLAISDVMMDKMDGFQFCQKLKSTPEISHIPVILMTALASVENKMTGYKAGADDYITKPFEPELLKIRVKNILDNLEKRKKEFGFDLQVSASELTISKIDEDFLNQVISLLEKNLDNADFDIDSFCRNLGVSSSYLYRKIKNITGLSPNEFIRTYRLKKAAVLIRESSMNVSEIAYQVGFNDALYFSKCFKKQFGTSPSLYFQNN
jgi:signal transduction histidine kinase/ligand-binding sensor domain-containing protein/DNA-binding response OmpR family regulator